MKKKSLPVSRLAHSTFALALGAALCASAAWADPPFDIEQRLAATVSPPAGATADSGPRHLPRHDQLVEQGIWRLEGMDPELPLDDLEPLRQILEGAQVVGLGETIHTSGGYYTMKHRLFRYLVERMGFRAFAIESNWDPADRVARYVDTCQGTPTDAVRGLFGVWQSAETRDLVEWMCSWNQENPDDPVSFFGFDIQQPEYDGPALITFLRGLGWADDDPRIQAIRQCDGVVTFSIPVAEETHQVCLQALDEVESLFAELDTSQALQGSREELEWAQVRLIGLRAWENESYWYDRNILRGYDERDRGMATVFQRIRKLRVGSAKTAVWAHNSHISRNSLEILGVTSMGSHLDREMGHRYANVALASYRPKVNWPGAFGCIQYPTFPASLERDLFALGEPFLLLDLDVNGANMAAHQPYVNPYQYHMIGYYWFQPARQFDALVYLETSPAMIPLRWAPCP
jgi:erythromycin esterase